MEEQLTKVKVDTEEGSFILGIDEKNAPVTAANFLSYVDGGHLTANSSIYRIVTLDNQPAETAHKIVVFQWGWRENEAHPERPFPPIPHETTKVTGLRHVEGTLSMARREPGSAGPGFFICGGDYPELDFGGRRNPDGQGFAAFGRVLEGQETINRIFARAQEVEQLTVPLAVRSVERLNQKPL